MKLLTAFLTIWVGCQFAQSAAATVNAWQEAEAIEWCHRQAGGSPEVCGPLPSADR